MHAILNFIASHYLQIGLALLYVDRALQVIFPNASVLAKIQTVLQDLGV